METTKAPVPRPRWIAPALAVVVLAVAWPLLLPWIYDTHDGHYVYYNAAQLDHALRDGQFPVRWLPDLFGGRGIPLFLYYHPLAFYLIFAVRLVVPGFIASVKIVELLAVALSAWSMLRFLEEHLPAEAAAIGAAAYVAAPMHVIELHVKGDPPAALAFAIAPLLFLGIRRAARGGAAGVAILAASGAALVLAHSVTALLLLPAAAIYAATELPRPIGPGVTRLAAGGALGFGLAAFHVLPALFERDLVYIDSVRGILAFDWREHFVAGWQWLSPLWGYRGSVAGTHDDMSFQIGPGHLAALAAGVFAVRRETKLSGFAFATAAYALLMTTSVSWPVWSAIGPLRYVQFPWRFLMPVAFATSTLAGIAVARLGAHRLVAATAITGPALTLAFAVGTGNRLYYALVVCQAVAIGAAWLVARAGRGSLAVALLFGALALPWSAVPLHARIKGEPIVVPIHEADLRPERVRLGIRRTTARDDYLPRAVGEASIPPRDPSQEYLPPPAATAPEEVTVRSGNVRVERVVRSGRGVRCDLDAPDGGIVTLDVHDFPGWSIAAVDRDRGVREELAPGRDDAGRIVVSLPPGRLRLDVIWRETPFRRRCDLVGAVAAIVTIAVGFRRRRN